MSKDFLQLLLEGSNCDDGEDVETNPEVDKEIEENWLPMSTIIENAFAAADMEVIAALETYEMACIVGGVQVVSEGLDRADANAILMEAANGFFTKIKETAKKIKDWFVSIFKKITDKFTIFSRDLSKKEQKLRPDFDKAWAEKKGKATYKGSIINTKTMLDMIHNINKDAKLMVDSPIKYFSSKSLEDIEDVMKNGRDEGLTKLVEKPTGNVHRRIMNAMTGQKSDNYDLTVADCTKVFKTRIGYGDEPKEITVSDADVAAMRAVINLSAKDLCNADKESVKYITDLANSTIKFIDKIEADSTKYPEVTKVISGVTQQLNTLSSSLATIMNTKIQIVTSAAKSYLGWMRSIAGGKADSGEEKGDDKSTATESYDMSYLFEFSEFDDAVTEGEDTLMEMFEWTNIKAVKEFFNGKKREAHALTKDANHAFKKGDYKEAKEKYKKALPIWKEILKNIANVPEKEPGMLSSNNWALFIPYLNLPVLLVLTYAAASTNKYVPKNRDLVDNERISKKVKTITRTGSISKKMLLESIETIIDYIEFQIKACDKPDGVVVEALSADAAELLAESMEVIAEAMEGEGCGDPDGNDDEGVEEGTDAFDLAMSFLQ